MIKLYYSNGDIMDAWQYILVYYISISIPSVIITVYDKIAAIKKAVRIPERTLMTFAALGGAAAMYVTMKAIRHKTLHKKFMIGLPVFIILHTLIIGLSYYFLITNSKDLVKTMLMQLNFLFFPDRKQT